VLDKERRNLSDGDDESESEDEGLFAKKDPKKETIADEERRLKAEFKKAAKVDESE